MDLLLSGQLPGKQSYKFEKFKEETEQILVDINMLIGLPISDMLQCKRRTYIFENIMQSYILANQKKRKVREVPIVDQQVIELLKEWVNTIKTGKLFEKTNKDLINHRLKCIVKASGKFDEFIRVSRHVGPEKITERKQTWEMISSHNLRKFAVTKYAKEHGIIIAAHYSGHADLKTIQKHYFGDVTVNDVLHIIRNKKNNYWLGKHSSSMSWWNQQCNPFLFSTSTR